jgi:hypothetical protein
MKKSVIAVLALGLMLFASGASANLIGLFADEAATACAADFPVYAYTNVYVTVMLTDIPAITAAEFRIDGIVQPNPLVVITPTWNSPLTIGSVFGDGFSIAFTTAQNGPIVPLGTIQFFPINEAWQAPDTMWCIVETLDSQLLAVVDDEFNTIPVDGWCFVADCMVGGPHGNCECLDTIATEETSWGAVKSLY